VDGLQEREEHRQPEEYPDVPRPERLAREALVAGVDERVDRERDDEEAQVIVCQCLICGYTEARPFERPSDERPALA